MSNPTEKPDVNAKNSDRFALFSLRVRISPERFELSMWDIQMLFVGMVLLVPTVIFGVFYGDWPARLAVVGGLVALVAFARRALVVTPKGAWVAQRVFGIRWRRMSLGREPIAYKEVGVDWQKLVVCPNDPANSTRQQRNKRCELVEWNDIDTHKSDAADRLMAIVTAEIKRLHAPVRAV